MGAALSSSAADRSPVISTSEKPQPGPVSADDTPARDRPGKPPARFGAPETRRHADLVKRSLLDKVEDRRTIHRDGIVGPTTEAALNNAQAPGWTATSAFSPMASIPTRPAAARRAAASASRYRQFWTMVLSSPVWWHHKSG